MHSDTFINTWIWHKPSISNSIHLSAPIRCCDCEGVTVENLPYKSCPITNRKRRWQAKLSADFWQVKLQLIYMCDHASNLLYFLWGITLNRIPGPKQFMSERNGFLYSMMGAPRSPHSWERRAGLSLIRGTDSLVRVGVKPGRSERMTSAIWTSISLRLVSLRVGGCGGGRYGCADKKPTSKVLIK